MELNLESIIFYILLLDAIGANILAYSDGQVWWQRHLNVFARYLPLARGWTTYYFILVILMGIMLHKNNILVLPF